MNNLLSKSWFRFISIVLIQAFLILDIAWAGGTELSVVNPTEMLSPSVQISQQVLSDSFNDLYEMQHLNTMFDMDKIKEMSLPEQMFEQKESNWANGWQRVKDWASETIKLMVQSHKSDKKDEDNNFISGIKLILIPAFLTTAIITLSSSIGWAGDGLTAGAISWIKENWGSASIIGAFIGIMTLSFILEAMYDGFKEVVKTWSMMVFLGIVLVIIFSSPFWVLVLLDGFSRTKIGVYVFKIGVQVLNFSFLGIVFSVCAWWILKGAIGVVKYFKELIVNFHNKMIRKKEIKELPKQREIEQLRREQDYKIEREQFIKKNPEVKPLFKEMERQNIPAETMLNGSIPAAYVAIERYFSNEIDRKKIKKIVVELGISFALENIWACSTIQHGVPLVAEIAQGDLEAFENNLKILESFVKKLYPVNPHELLLFAESLLEKYGVDRYPFDELLQVSSLFPEWFRKARHMYLGTDLLERISLEMIKKTDDLFLLKTLLKIEIQHVGRNIERTLERRKIRTIEEVTFIETGETIDSGACPSGYNRDSPLPEGDWVLIEGSEYFGQPDSYGGDNIFGTYAKGYWQTTQSDEFEEIVHESALSFVETKDLESMTINILLMNAQHSTFDELNADVLLLCGNDDIGTFQETLRLYKAGKVKKILLTGGYGRLTLPLMKAALKIGVAFKLYDNIIRSAGDLENLQIPGYEEPINLELLDKQPGRDKFKKIIQVSEAVFINKVMHFLAKRMNIELDDKDIYLETKSTNTLENFKLAIPYLEQIKKDLDKDEIKVAYMQVPHQQFRTKATFNRFKDEWKDIGVTGISYTTDWDTSDLSAEQKIEMIASELWRVAIYSAKGDLVPLYGEQEGLDAVPDEYWKQLAQAVYNLDPVAKERLRSLLFNLSLGVKIDNKQVFKTEKGLRDYLDTKGVVASGWLDSFINFIYTQSSKQVIVDESITNGIIKSADTLKSDLNLNSGLALIGQAI